MNKEIISLAIKKARQSDCNYRVSCIGLNSHGDVIGSSVNKHKDNGKGKGLHAEVELIKKFGRKIRTIIICRCNSQGIILPIHPCDTCKKILDRMNIDIITIKEI
jgi:tRNA(Arg) A34 adenosine deaminase TadA